MPSAARQIPWHGIATVGNPGLIFTSAAKLAVAGCVLGLLGAAAASHLLQTLRSE